MPRSKSAELTPPQAALLAALERDERASIRELVAALGWSNPSVVAYHLRELQAKGKIRHDARKARSIRIVKQP